jgi:hypothetical protein
MRRHAVHDADGLTLDKDLMMRPSVILLLPYFAEN